MNYLTSDENNYTAEVILSEVPTNGWILFFYGSRKGRIFQETVFLQSTGKEDAIEEVFEYLEAGDDIDKRHEVMSILSILTQGGPDDEPGIMDSSSDDLAVSDENFGVCSRYVDSSEPLS